MTRHRISLEEFHRRVEAGVFPEDLRLELVEGDLVEMRPIGPRCAAIVRRLTSPLAPLVLEGKALLSGQNPLVVKVADTSLRYDLSTQLHLYAQGGVPEAWVVDLEGQRILVHRHPQGASYGEVETLGPGKRLSFLGVEIPTEELL
ncbi:MULTISPECIES: Uma2 family endonuclease [Thermus]|uniref:Uma2 family endonuclease n=1 Tax=Thermus TaxID=270 RepID=UPI001F342629|nr:MULTISPECIES: Uma2 family endonuclease [Thermus]